VPRQVPPLNATRLASLKPPATGRIELYDGACPGLVLRLPASGAASWSYKFWDKAAGKQERLTLGRFPTVGLAQARDRATKARAGLLDGVNPAAALRQRRDAIRFEDAVPRYLAYLDSIGKASRKNDSSLLSRPKLAWRGVALDRIDRRMVAELVDDVGRDHPRTANAILTALKGLFAWAVDRAGLLRESPVTGMRPLFKTAARERVLSAEEITALWAATASGAGALDRDPADVLRLALLTGQRSQQLRDLRRAEVVDLDGPAPRLAWPGARMKVKNRAQAIPLTGEALRIVREALERHPGEVLFALHKHTLSRAVSDFLGDAAGAWTPHDLRRTHLTLAAELGVKDEVRDAIAAHNAGVRSIYDRSSKHLEMAAAFAAIESRIGEITGEGSPPGTTVLPLRGRRKQP
jgi:integrase